MPATEKLGPAFPNDCVPWSSRPVNGLVFPVKTWRKGTLSLMGRRAGAAGAGACVSQAVKEDLRPGPLPGLWGSCQPWPCLCLGCSWSPTRSASGGRSVRKVLETSQESGGRRGIL